MMSASIFDDASKVSAAFKALQTPAIERYDVHARQELEEASQNYLLWIANLGVLDSGHSSLDYRLQDVPDTVEFVRDLLADLGRYLEDFRRYGRREDSAASQAEGHSDQDESEEESDSDEDDLDELQATVISVKNTLRRLFRVARTIRNYGTRSTPGHRDVYSIGPAEDRLATKEQLIALESRRISDFIYFARTCEHDGFLDPTEQIIFDQDDQTLVHRLSRLGSERRQRFIYWRHPNESSTRTARFQAAEADAPQTLPGLNVPLLTPIPTTGRPLHLPSMPSSVTKVRRDQVEFAERASVISAVSRPPSMREPSGQRAAWPIPPPLKELSGGEYFECPYCFNVCPARYRRTPGAWKSHLIHDLMPYSCTYPNCDSVDRLYDSFADWASHELTHNKVWSCLEHADQEFTTPDQYRAHIQEQHSGNPDMVTAEVMSARATGSDHSGRHCPICLAEIARTSEMQKHVAWHLETLALSNLPRSTGVEQGSQEGDLDSQVSQAQKIGDAESRCGDLDDVSLPDEDKLIAKAPQEKDRGEEGDFGFQEHELSDLDSLFGHPDNISDPGENKPDEDQLKARSVKASIANASGPIAEITLEDVLNDAARHPYTLLALRSYMSQQNRHQILDFITVAREYGKEYDEALTLVADESYLTRDTGPGVLLSRK